MILYVDETECPEYFIVTGLLVNSKEDVELAFKRFKKSIKNTPMDEDLKARLFTEFKSAFMDRRYQHLKIKMLKELNKFEYCGIYSCYIKKAIFTQSVKEKVYTSLLMRIVASISHGIDIVFDTFNNPAFESDIMNCLIGCPNVKSIKPCDSQKDVGIQFVDNLCGVFRLMKTGKDEYNFYDLIKEFVKEI